MPNLLENTSFGLIRTNPRLTTNTKLVVDSRDRFYLDSFDANNELSKDRYKGYKLSINNSYKYDLNKFYRNGKTPSEITFDIQRKISDNSVLDNYDNQYEFQYSYGAEFIKSKLYDEEFGILAPLWLEKKLPDYFVIFKLENPVTIEDLSEDSENYNIDIINDPENFIDLYLNNAKIIKTINLTDKSNIGKYIRNYINDENFPISPINISIEKDVASQWNGINIESGGFTSKKEFIYDNIIGLENTIIEDDFFITNGFKRNNTAIANIINFQFLFDDKEADNFTINRYFGLYVSANDEGTFNISGKAISENIDNQYPKLLDGKPLKTNNTKEFLQNNESGVKFYIDKETINTVYNTDNHSQFIPTSEDVNHLKSFFYIKDKDDNFYNLKRSSNWNSGDELRIYDKKIDLSKFTGYKNTLNNIKGRVLSGKNKKSSSIIQVNDIISNGDRYIAGLPKKQEYIISADEVIPGTTYTISTGDNSISFSALNSNLNDLLINIKNEWDNSLLEPFNNFILTIKDDILYIIEKNVTGVDVDFYIESNNTDSFLDIEKTVSGSLYPITITADNNLNIQYGGAIGRRFNPNGTKEEIAKAMTAAFNNIDNNFIYAVSINNKIILTSTIAGKRFNDIIIGRDSYLFSDSVNINSNTIGFNHPEFNIYKFEGGSNNEKSNISIKNEDLSLIKPGVTYIRVKSKDDNIEILPIISISEYIDDPIYDNDGNITGYNNIDKYKTIYIGDENDIFLDNYSNIYIYELFKIPFGRFSIFPMKDLDGDFFDNYYNDKKELDIEKDFYEKYDTVDSIYTHKDISNFYDNDDLVGLNEINNIDTEFAINEYDILNENYIKELSTVSRIIPFINKWVYKNGKDIRENDYRLNFSKNFGICNFSPSPDEYSRNSYYFTHEWYYLQGMPQYFSDYIGIDSEVDNNIFSYFPDNIDVTESGLLNQDYDYFTEYFIVNKLKYISNNTDNSVLYDIKPINNQIRYSRFLGGNKFNYAEAFHRGVKVIIKERSDNNIDFNFNLQKIKTSKNGKYNDYKFSCVLIPHSGEYTSGINRKKIEIEFIENKKYKNITLLIYCFIDDVLLQDEYMSNRFDRTILYSLNSKFISKFVDDMNTDGSMDYADINLSGSIDMRFSSGTNFGAGDVKAIQDISGDNPDFLNEVIINEDGGYNLIEAVSGQFIREFQVNNVISNNHLIGSDFTGGPQPVGLIDFLVKTGEYIYKSGGYNHWTSRLNKISFANIANMINTGDPMIKYKSILEDGSIKDNLFLIELNSAKITMIPNYISSKFDENKPVQFNLIDKIGYNLEYKQNSNIQPTYRHSGYYQPKFKDIFTFLDPYIDINENDITDNILQLKNKFKFNNTQLDINHKLLKIDNLFYHKINEFEGNSILELNNEDSFKPVYPLINEVAIEKRDFNLWNSNWDPGYYVRSISKSNNILIPGSNSMKEQKSFFGSKIMKIVDDLIIDKFNVLESDTIDSISELIDISLNENNDTDIIYFDNENTCEINILLEKKLIRLIKNEKIVDYFSKWIKSEFSIGDIDTLDDDIEQYIILNILPRYIISNIDLYELKSNNSGISNSVNIEGNLSNEEKENLGYIKNNNFNYTILSNRSNFDIKLIYNKISGFNYSLAPSIKISKR